MLHFFLSGLLLAISLSVSAKAEVCSAPRSTIAVKEKGVIKWSTKVVGISSHVRVKRNRLSGGTATPWPFF
jgi:hypothetical protein